MLAQERWNQLRIDSFRTKAYRDQSSKVHAKVSGPSIVTSTYVQVSCGSKIEAFQLSGSFPIPSRTALLKRSRSCGKEMLLLKITGMFYASSYEDQRLRQLHEAARKHHAIPVSPATPSHHCPICSLAHCSRMKPITPYRTSFGCAVGINRL